MTGFSVDKDGKQTGGLEQWATSLGKMVGSVKGLWQQLETGKKKFDAMNAAAGKSKSSFSDYIKYISESEDATEAFGIATLYTRARVLLLNMALSTGLALAASLIVKKIAEASQSIETNATKSKEAADAAQSTTSSLKDLVSAYEELGEKSGWDTEDFDQAKDIQAEILDLAKEQGTLDEDKLGSIDLQNGKYQEQLDILKDITSEQLKASQKELVQSKDAQGTKLVQTAKKNNRSHWIGTFWSNAEMQMGDQIKDADIDIFNWAGGYGANDINDADSIVDYYNNLGKAIEYIIDNTTDEERAVNGKYHALYQFLMDERNALKDDVDSYNDSISALKQNQFKSDFAEWSANETKKSTQATSEIDAKIKATKEYQDAVKEAQKTEEEWNSQGYGKYGNIDNFHRDKIDWTEENLAKYKDFVDEQNSIFPGTIEKGSYSTVLGSWDTISNEDGTEHPFAFTPMLQTDSGLVPLTEDQLWNYIDTIVEQCYDENGKLDIDKLMELDATGLKQDINGVMMQVKGMIAGVAGGKDPNGGVYSAADILAQSGDSNEDIKNDLIDLYGPDVDLTPVDDNGNLSRYVGKSMHDAQAVAQEGKDNIEAVYDQLYNDLENSPSGESDGSSSAPVRYVDHIKSAFETLADSLGKSSGEMTVSDVVGLSQDGVQLTDEQAQALDTLTAAADKYGTTIQGVAEAGEENGLFGGIENAQNGIAAAAQQMDTISKKIDEIQSAYKACTTAMDEYNKYGYMSTDALQGLLSMSDEYLACLDVVDGKLQINNDRYADLIAAQYTEAEVTAIEQAVNELNALQKEDAKEKTEGLTTATEEQQTALENAIPAIKDATVATGDLAVALAAAQGAAEGDADMQAKIDTITNALNTRLTAIHTNMQAAINSGAAVRNQLKGFDKDSKKSGKTSSKSVTDVASAFDTLTKAMKEYNQYGYISADTMKSMMKLEDKFTSCLVKNGDKLEINANEFRKLVETQLKQEEASGKASKSADELKRILSYLDSNVHSSTISFEQLTDVIKGYGTAMDEAKEKTDAIKSAFSGLSDVLQTLSESQFGISDSDAVDKQADAVRELVTLYKDYPDLLNNIVDEKGNINLNTEAFKNALADTLEQLATTAKETGGAGADALYNAYHTASVNISQDIISVNDYINGLGTDLSNANSVLDKYQTNWSTLKDVMDEWNSTGQLTQDSMQKIMELPEEFSSLLSYDENGVANLDVKTLRNNYVKQLEDLAKEFKGKPIGIQAEAMIEEVREPTPEEYEELAKKTLTYQRALAKYIKKVSRIDDNKDLTEDEALQQKAAAQAELDGALQQSLQDVKETDAEVATKLKKHWEGVEAVIENFKSALSDVKSVLNGILSLIETFGTTNSNDLKIWGEAMTEHIDDQIEALNKQKEALEDANDEEERAIALAKLQAELEKARTQRTVRKYTSNGYEWVADASAVKEAQDNLNDQQRTWRKEDAEKAIDDQIDKLNELKDKYSEVINLIGTSWDDYNKKLKYSAEVADMTFTEMEGRVDTFKDKVVGSMKSSGATSGLQDFISKLESFESVLEKINNLYSWAEEGFGNYTDKGTTGLLIRIASWFSSDGKEKITSSLGSVVKNIKGIFNRSGSELAKESSKAATKVAIATSKSLNSSSGLVGVFQSAWAKIAKGASNLFGGRGGLTSIFANGAKTIGSLFSKVGTAIVGGGATTAGAATAAGAAGTGIAVSASTLPVIGLIVAGVINGVNSNISLIKDQKKIWSSDDKTGVKIAKSIGSVVWRTSLFGGIASTIENISGFVKKIFGIESKKDKNNNSSSNGKIDVGNIIINSPDSPASNISSTTSESNDSAKQSLWDRIKNSKFWFWNWGKRAVGDKDIKYSGMYNVDEQGPELLVRHPASGRYTYLETGDGVVPADITSKLFEMGGNTDKWFADQLSKNGALKNGALNNIQNKTIGDTISVGDIYIQNPVRDTDALAREIVRDLPIKLRQQQGRR